MASLSNRNLGVVEKFRAPAALWIPYPDTPGEWIEQSGVGRGGKVIIQVQDNVNAAKAPVNVVRFVLHNGQDIVNGRILEGLPIEQSKGNENEILFKTASSSTYQVRRKTIYRIRFESSTDTEDFLMWWYAKNGSIKKWVAESSKSYKRKSTDETYGFGAKKKRLKTQARISKNNESATSLRHIIDIKRTKDIDRKCDSAAQILAESTNVKDEAPEMREDKQKSFGGKESKNNYVSKSKENGIISSKLSEKRDIIIDDDYAPLSQNLFEFLDLESP